MAWLLYGIAYIGGGVSIAEHAWHSLRRLRINIDSLMLLAAGGSAALGDLAEGCVLLFLFSLSHALEGYVLGRARREIRGLMKFMPDEARVLRDATEVTLALHDIKVDDVVVVRPSERVPLDGIVLQGRSSVNEAPVTGESLPVTKEAGSRVLAGSLNLDGVLTFRVQRAVHETTLARMIELVEQAQASKATSQRFAAWFETRYPTLVVLIVSLLFAGSWWYTGELSRSFYWAMTILVAGSPCAVVISIPSATLAAIAQAARFGILFKGGIHLETLAKVTAIAFDKTGTLTTGRPRVGAIVPVKGVTEAELLSIAVSLEKDSEHPIARAFVELAEAQLDVPQATEVRILVARGVQATLGGETARIGQLSWLTKEVAEPPAELTTAISQIQAAGGTVFGATRGSKWLGVFGIADELHPGTASTLQELRQSGITKLVMLTGDHTAPASRIAQSLGIDFRAELLPQQKLDFLQHWKQSGEVTAMVGDGMNDAPALAAADVGISLGGAGTDVALETADVVLMGSDLLWLPYAIDLARSSRRTIRQNLIISLGWMAGLLVVGVAGVLPLPIAVLCHEGSTLLVILNSVSLLLVSRNRSPTLRVGP